MYKPLPENVTIKSSEIHGFGLFTTEDIPVGVIIGITHILDSRWPDGLIRLPLGGFYNHSMGPNVKNCEEYHQEYQCKVIYMVAITNISAGDEITCTYTYYDPTE
jgi:hypothetical protein